MTPDAMQEFKLLSSPLDGTNLIEASAGTGKTFAIAGIFIRLLLEKKLKVGEVLVVTYTIAATEELRDRIRTTIRAAIAAFVRGGSEDVFLDGLVKGHPESGQAHALLKAALRDFDEAAIHTIHSFCRRTLQEHAFESMNAFDTTFVSDEGPLREEIVRDFWRRRFYEAPAEVAAYALDKKDDLRAFLRLMQRQRHLQDLRIVPDMPPVTPPSPAGIREAFSRMAGAWGGCREEILNKLHDPGLHQGKYKNPAQLASAMDRYVKTGMAVPVFPSLERFSASGLKEATKKGGTTPEHPFFDLCEDLQNALAAFAEGMNNYLLHTKAVLFDYVREELRRRKEQRHIQSFDDLLVNLHDALEKPTAGDLVRELRGRFRAALIDEFQDTDPVSYAIFRRIFRHEETSLFLIGDPKQAIYSFRGADLFAYMSAHEQVDNRYTLSHNWRSAAPLIEAVNTVFSHHDNPFLYRQIGFEPVVPGKTKNRPQLVFSEKDTAPLQLWLIDRTRMDKLGAADNKDQARKAIAEAVAAEISRLMALGRENKASIGERGLAAGDMAILVRDRYEARITQDALRRLAIPSVLHSAGNIFDTGEAGDVQRLLAGISEPHQEGRLRAALTTSLMGIKGEVLAALSENERDREEWIFRFRQYHQLWERNGFMAMFRQLLLREGVRERLLALPDGERRLTNILHLSEILHAEAMKQKLGMAGLLKWLSRQRDPETARSEEHELRLENDADAVKIVTIHKSKGLEYPIVFCPFNWGGSQITETTFTYHERDAQSGDWRLCLALDGKANPHLADAERESLAENIRLLYVALTRAKYRCYVVWGPFNEGKTSAPAYIFHPPEETPDHILEAMSHRFPALTDDAIRGDLQNLAARSRGTIDVLDMPSTPGMNVAPMPSAQTDLTCRTFSATIERNERIASFSYFLAGRTSEPAIVAEGSDDLPDRDAGLAVTGPAPRESLSGIFAFPRGARAGTLLHDIWEHLDFPDGEGEAAEALVTAKLKEHGFDAMWRQTILDMIGKLLKAPLDGQNPNFNLSQIAMEDRVSELEFYFPLKSTTSESLKSIFSGVGKPMTTGFPERLGRLNFHPARGFMKGFIDLFFRYENRFYLVDWKSNFLGSRIEDYGQDVLSNVMQDDYYVLQYHLYVLALHLYLKARLPDYDYDRHFGGAFYIFLRGVDPARGPEFGIFRDRPGNDVVETLEKGLIEAP